MSAGARSRIAVQWLPVVLFLGFVAVAVIDTHATAANKLPVIANISAGEPSTIAPAIAPQASPAKSDQAGRAPQPIVIAALATPTPPAETVAAPVAVPAPPATIAPLISSKPAPSPARFFTINEVMARQTGRTQDKSQGNIQLASVDPTATPDVSGYSQDAKGEEPFGLFTFVAPDGIVWFKWRKVADDIRAQEPALLRCLADAAQCSPAAARFAAIVSEARGHEGRVRLNFVNQRVNNAIRYTSDMAQWATPDEWSAPFAAGRGAFETGLGDCEDYAIAKYVALRAAGVPAKRLRVLLVRDNIARLDHAVLAANEDGRWYVLDNRWTAAVEDNDVQRFTPLFALDDQGVKLLAAPYASRGESRAEPRIELMSEAVKGKSAASNSARTARKVLPGDDTAEAPSFGSLDLRPSLSTLGLRSSVL
jgi:predicted transglutaminase-like cysteine proteinase